MLVGRIKDIIITSGVNIFPEDIEALVHSVKGIYAGRVVAFGVDDPVAGDGKSGSRGGNARRV